MQEKLFDWLKQEIDQVNTKVDKLDEKMDELIKFKWQVVSGTIVVSCILGVAFQILIAIIGRN